MIKIKNWILKVKAIDLVDRCIMAIMIILMLQIIYDLFTHNAGQNNAIDIVVRTSSASLFGYIMSANFIRHTPNPTSSSDIIPPTTFLSYPLTIDSTTSMTSTPNHQVIQSLDDAPSNRVNSENLTTNPDQTTRPHDIQILFVATIGIIALVSLLIANDLIMIDASVASTLSQLRDFVSGSIGFLVGCSTHSIKT